ncbi:MAG TPA: phage minor head protein [Bacteroidales bacterium]|nr:phage minor head protein [Bacteroidales bacterium]
MQIEVNKYKQTFFKNIYWRKGIKVLTACHASIIERVMDVDPRDLKPRIAGLLNKKPVEMYVKEMWIKTGSYFAANTIKRIRGKGDDVDLSYKDGALDEMIDYWEDYFRRYTNERSMFVIGSIMDTQTVIVNNLIDQVVAEAMSEGLSIYQIQKRLQNELTEGMTMVNKYQAERIARTEVNSASNKGSFDSAEQTGLCTGKRWSSSHRKDARTLHIEYESLGEVPMDYLYDGMLYPLDPNGGPDQIINCGCTHILNYD